MRPLLPLGVLLALLLLLGAGLQRDPQAIPSPLIGKPAPAFALAQLERPEQSFGPQEMKGKVWLLNVWASWCVGCRQEHAALLALAKRGVAPIVGLDYMDDAAAASQWLSQHGNPYQLTVVDARGKVGIDYGVYGVPETFVIDKLGVVRLKLTGPVSAEAIDKDILPLIQRLNRG